jgi:TRAP-type transport system small permease protein
VPFAALRRGFELALEWIVIVLMVTLAVIVTAGVAFRYTGNALVWYDEAASILLAWVTYYGAALAALKRANIGVPELVHMLPPTQRVVVALVAEVFVFGFFILLAWVGYTVLEILAYDNLVSMPGVSVAYAQSVIPISAVLFIIAEAMSLPEIIRKARRP